jgi:hypothetical protein
MFSQHLFGLTDQSLSHPAISVRNFNGQTVYPSFAQRPFSNAPKKKSGWVLISFEMDCLLSRPFGLKGNSALDQSSMIFG